MQASAGNLKRVSLELGGKSPDIIFADADIEAAVAGASNGVFGNSGQVCYAGTRVFVERKVYEEVVARVGLRQRAGRRQQPRPTPRSARSSLSRNWTESRATSTSERGGRTDRRRRNAIVDGDLAKGYFLAPTVFADVKDDMRIAQEEIFGPVASVMPFDSVDEVKKRANLTNFGLGGGVWTRDVGKAHQLASRDQHRGRVGQLLLGLTDPAMPHGGSKMSGWGNEFSIQRSRRIPQRQSGVDSNRVAR